MESKKKSCCTARVLLLLQQLCDAQGGFVCERVDPTRAGFDGNQIELKATQG